MYFHLKRIGREFYSFLEELPLKKKIFFSLTFIFHLFFFRFGRDEYNLWLRSYESAPLRELCFIYVLFFFYNAINYFLFYQLCLRLGLEWFNSKKEKFFSKIYLFRNTSSYEGLTRIFSLASEIISLTQLFCLLTRFFLILCFSFFELFYAFFLGGSPQEAIFELGILCFFLFFYGFYIFLYPPFFKNVYINEVKYIEIKNRIKKRLLSLNQNYHTILHTKNLAWEKTCLKKELKLLFFKALIKDRSIQQEEFYISFIFYGIGLSEFLKAIVLSVSYFLFPLSSSSVNSLTSISNFFLFFAYSIYYLKKFKYFITKEKFFNEKAGVSKKFSFKIQRAKRRKTFFFEGVVRKEKISIQETFGTQLLLQRKFAKEIIFEIFFGRTADKKKQSQGLLKLPENCWILNPSPIFSGFNTLKEYFYVSLNLKAEAFEQDKELIQQIEFYFKKFNLVPLYSKFQTPLDLERVLSGGEKQRIEFICALIAGIKFFVSEFFFAHNDPLTKSLLAKEFQEKKLHLLLLNTAFEELPAELKLSKKIL